MATLDDLARIALALPSVEGAGTDFGVLGKGMTWAYLARSHPKGRREVVPGVIAIRCPIESKELLIEAAPERFFTDDHYRGYPAVLARLDVLDVDELEGLVRRAWTVQAPAKLRKAT